MSERPRVERMVMFKHGVAYLERRGPAEGSFELSFRREEMNDVLKSLAVWVAEGDARVGAIGFEAPEDPEKALAERKLLLARGDALEGLLQSLRGRRVVVDDGHARHEGEVIGTETVAGREGPPLRSLLLRRAGAMGEVAVVDLAAVRGLSLLEDPSRENLAFIVDRGRAATSGENRVVRVAVEGRAADLRASYVIPAPTWRVSYRLVREEGSTVLMAMGIVHNPVDEDLSDISLTLTTGQPVSFVIDLYHPKTVARAVVEETSRAAAAPTRFERARPVAAAPAARMRAEMVGGAPAAVAGGGGVEEARERAMGAGLAAAGMAEGVDRGELFEYRVASRVSLKRGGSAMVPLVSARLDAAKERVWREGPVPNPDLVITFKNTSGAVLEEGAAVIYDGGVYAGESMVPYSARGAEVKLGYAKDLAVQCRTESTQSVSFTGLRYAKHAVAEVLRTEVRITVHAENDGDEGIDLIAELPRRGGFSLSDLNQSQLPFEETASYWRFRTQVPAHGKASFKVHASRVDSRAVSFDAIDAATLKRWREQGDLDTGLFTALTEVLRLEAEAKRRDQKAEAIEKQRKEAYQKQSKISEQLGVLKDGGPEGALRLRYVKELEAEQDRINAADAELARLRQDAEQKRAQAAERLEQAKAEMPKGARE